MEVRGRGAAGGRQGEREARILQVAGDLLRRWGYRRVTVDDVAAKAGVGKGTVYLHWSSREELFRAVLVQEVRGAIGDVVRALRGDPGDPGAWRPHRLARTYAAAIRSRPLLVALALDDADILGGLTLPDDGRFGPHGLASVAYFTRLADAGLLIDDLTPASAAFAFAAVLEGFLRAPSDEDDVLTIVVRNAFENERDLTPAREEALRADVIGIFAALVGTEPVEEAES